MLKHGILGLINNGDKTGYEIMTVFRDSLRHFWTAQTSQIYRELQAMEKLGWISQTHIPQDGRPDKNVFSITPAGHAELLHWLREDKLPDSVRNPFLMKIFFMGELPVEENLAFFRVFRDAAIFPDGGEQTAAKAEMYSRAVKDPEKAVYWKLTIAFGLLYQKMQREWCDYCIRELEALKLKNEENENEETV